MNMVLRMETDTCKNVQPWENKMTLLTELQQDSNDHWSHWI